MIGLGFRGSTQPVAQIGFDPIREVADAQGVDGGREGTAGGAGGGGNPVGRDRLADRPGSVDDEPVRHGTVPLGFPRQY